MTEPAEEQPNPKLIPRPVPSHARVERLFAGTADTGLPWLGLPFSNDTVAELADAPDSEAVTARVDRPGDSSIEGSIPSGVTLSNDSGGVESLCAKQVDALRSGHAKARHAVAEYQKLGVSAPERREPTMKLLGTGVAPGLLSPSLSPRAIPRAAE